MSVLERDGASLAFDEKGAGTVVILQHPLTADGGVWRRLGIVDDLVERGFRCVSLDALGHGRSAASATLRVGLAERVRDVLAVADAVGAAQFHYAGYSMGGWIGVGLIESAPRRLLSAAIAGWDPVDGARKFTNETGTMARRTEFVDTITFLTSQRTNQEGPSEAAIAGFVDTFERLFIDLPSIATLIGVEFPVMIACGSDDPYVDAARSAAEALDFPFLSLPGNHVDAFQSPGFRTHLVGWLADVETARSKPT